MFPLKPQLQILLENGSSPCHIICKLADFWLADHNGRKRDLFQRAVENY